MELAGRLAVLAACAVATGVLFILAAAPTPPRPSGGERVGPAPLPGFVPAALFAFLVLAGGGALTGAGMLATDPVAPTAVAVQGVGVLLLVAAGAVGVRGAALRHHAPATMLPLELAWIGATLALASWLAAIGTVFIVFLAGIRVEPAPRP